MHFFTEPAKLENQGVADVFGPLDGDEANRFRISSKYNVTLADATAKVFACQDAMMLVLPHITAGTNVVDLDLVNLVLKPIKELDIPFSPVKYYIYRGVELDSFIDGGAITADDPLTKTEFITKFWQNWGNYTTDLGIPPVPAPSPQSFGYDAGLALSPRKEEFIEEYFHSEESTNTVINDFQAIKVTEGEWIGNIDNGTDFEFEIVMDTDHITMDLEYAQMSVQEIDATGLAIDASNPSLDAIAAREKVLNYIDPVAFFGMHHEVGVYVGSWAGPVKNPSVLHQDEDIIGNVLNTSLNNDVVYLDIRSERGYSYYFYQNYRLDAFSGSILQYSEALQLKSESQASFNYVDYATLDWPLINLKTPPSLIAPIVEGETVELKLLEKDNENPLLFVENPRLLGAANRNNFIEEADLIDPSITEYTQTIELEPPFYDDGGTDKNYPYHIKLQYFRTLDSDNSPNTVFKAPTYLDGAFGGVSIPELNVNTPFKHLENAKRTFIRDANFAYVAKSGIFQQGTQVLFYAEKDFSLRASPDVYPRFDPVGTPPEDIDAILSIKNVVLNRWEINDGVEDISILGIVGYNRTVLEETPVEDFMFIGITQAELNDLDGMAGVSDLHHKYFILTELLDVGDIPFVDTISGGRYRKYRIDIQGIDAVTGQVTVIPSSTLATEVVVYGMTNFALCSKDFGAASNVPVQIPDPGVYSEYPDCHVVAYDDRSTMVTDLFPGGIVALLDNKMSWDGGAPFAFENVSLVGELFYPVNNIGDDELSDREDNYPLIVILHANGGRYTDYRALARHLAKNGFIVTSTSALIVTGNNFPIFRLDDLPSAPAPAVGGAFAAWRFWIGGVPYEDRQYYFTLAGSPFVGPDYYVISDWQLDTMYVYGNNAGDAATYERLSYIEFSTQDNYPQENAMAKAHTYIAHTVLGWQKGVDFDIFIEPTDFLWEREGGKPGFGGLDKFGLAWLLNVDLGGGNFAARLTRTGDRLVELVAADWLLDDHEAIVGVIDAAADVPSIDIDFPDPAIDRYFGTIVAGVYYMIRVDASTAVACPQGTCVTIAGQVTNRQLELKLNLGRQGLRILSRANLAFPHIQIVKKYIEEEFPKAPTDRVQNNIGLIGHSRGAEAVVRCVSEIAAGGVNPFDVADFIMTGADNRIAPNWNNLPDDCNNVNAVISLAPTDASRDQNESIDQDIPYHVIYGSMEGDVVGIDLPLGPPNRTSGFSLYDRTNNDTEKSMAFLYGATHNGFVTTNFDFINLQNSSGALGATVAPAIQSRTILAYMNGFMRTHLKGESVWKPIFHGDSIPTSIAFDRIFTQFRDMEVPLSPTKWINDFAAAGGVTLDGAAPAPLTDLQFGELVNLDSRTPHDTQGIRVAWAAGVESVLLIPVTGAPRDISMYDYLSFRIGMALDTVVPIAYADLSTILVQFHYTGMPALPLLYSEELNREVPAPDPRDLPVYGGVPAALAKTAMMTVRIPLAGFQTNGVDLTAITNVSLTFPATLTEPGAVLIDDVEFTN